MFSPKAALALISQLSWASILMLPGVSLLQSSASAADTASSQDAVTTYDETEHGFCDAQMLSAYWGKNTYQAKVKAGEMLLDSQADQLEDSLTQARRRHAGQIDCWYGHDGFGYEDAVALADYWNVSIGEAKTALGNKLEQGGLGLAKWAVKEAHHTSTAEHSYDAGNLVNTPVLTAQVKNSQNTTDPQAKKRREWDAFFSSQYTPWDAKVLSEFWGQDLGETKARMGRKLIWGPSNQAILDQFLVDARVQALQSVERLDLYAESSYQYDDAQALAKFWGDPTPYDAKLRIERNLIMGNEQVVRDALQFARRS